jgi:hypothetical protein
MAVRTRKPPKLTPRQRGTMTTLQGKTALVTGASRGIGRATAMALAAAGARLLVHYGRSAQEADEVVAAIKAQGGRADAEFRTAQRSSPSRCALSSAIASMYSSSTPASAKQRASQITWSQTLTASSRPTSVARSLWCSNCCPSWARAQTSSSSPLSALVQLWASRASRTPRFSPTPPPKVPLRRS